ncbi:MAG: GlsB/YeaQ/YmgE family stress response membrane protein [Anaerolineales bacterium]
MVGFIGAFLGWWIANALNLPLLFQVKIQGREFPVLWSIIGGVIFVSVINLINRRR